VPGAKVREGRRVDPPRALSGSGAASGISGAYLADQPVWSPSCEKRNLVAGDSMKKMKLLVDVVRAVWLVMGYLGEDGGRIAVPRAATRIGD
jgi:hypothetical protein